MSRLILVALLLSVPTTLGETTTTTTEPPTTIPTTTTTEPSTTMGDPYATVPTTTTTEPSTTMGDPYATVPTTTTTEPSTTMGDPYATVPTTTTTEPPTTIGDPYATVPTTTTTEPPTTTILSDKNGTVISTTFVDTANNVSTQMTTDSDTQTTAIISTTTRNNSNATVLTSPIFAVTTTTNTTPVSATTQPPVTTATTKVTTTTKPPTTTPPLVETKPPNPDIVYNLTFHLPFYRPWNVDLNDPASPAYAELRREVKGTVDAAFAGCPGFKLCEVTGFELFMMNTTLIVSSFADNQNTTRNFTNAVYNTSFSYEAVSASNGTDIIRFIQQNASIILANATITCTHDNKTYGVDSSVTTTMNSEAAAQSTVFMESPCLWSTNPCDPCYSCDGTQPVGSISICQLYCSPAEHKYCQIVNNAVLPWEYECSCQSGYLPVGGDCVSDDLIIGLSVGIGAAVLVALTAVIIYLAVRMSSHSSGKSDTGSSVKNEAQRTSSDEEIVKKSPLGIDNPAAAVAADFMAVDVNPDDVDVEVDVDDGHVAAAAVAVVAGGGGVETVAGAAVITAAAVELQAEVHQQQQQPNVVTISQSHSQPIVMEPDYDQSQPMSLNTQHFNSSDIELAFSTFVPQLRNVDTQGNYYIKRPVSVKTATSRSQPGPPYYQNPSYRDFFEEENQ